MAMPGNQPIDVQFGITINDSGGGGSNISKETKEKQLNAQATRDGMMQNRMYANSLLGINMSLLGVMFGYQNFTKALNAEKTAELQSLQLKEKKSRQDKERIKQLRKEQIEQEKLNTKVMAGISTVQFLASIMQIMLVIRNMQIGAINREAAAEARGTTVKAMNTRVTTKQAASEGTLQIAKSGWLAPVMAALLIAGMIGVGAVAWNIFSKGAANGAFVPARAGGELFTVGEGGQDEIIAPDPKLRQIVREESGGAGMVIINAIDTESFNEVLGRSSESRRLQGVNP